MWRQRERGVAWFPDAEAVCVDNLRGQVDREIGVRDVPEFGRGVHRGEDRGVGSGLDLGPGPVEKPEGWIGQWDTANGAVALGILLEFGSPCQCLLGRSDGAKNDTPGRACFGCDVGGDGVACLMVSI